MCVFVCLQLCVFRTAPVFYIWQAVGGRQLCALLSSIGLHIRKSRVPPSGSKSSLLQSIFLLSIPLLNNPVKKTKVTAQLHTVCNPFLSHWHGALSVKENTQVRSLGAWLVLFWLVRPMMSEPIRCRCWNWKENIWGLWTLGPIR